MGTASGKHIAFIGGGNMASAIISGLLRQGHSASDIAVVEPFAPTRERLLAAYGVAAAPAAGPQLRSADLVVWAVKPQSFADAAAQAAPFTGQALHLSVAAGIPSSSIAAWLGSERVVRCMPNTPALIGQGISGLYARPAVAEADRSLVQSVMDSTGASIWLQDESQLDAVTALSGSGPAYVYFFLEAMADAGVMMGLAREQAHQLAVATFIGAGELARQSDEPPQVLRERVTSKGGTTHAAITSMQASRMKEHFETALLAAQQRATELGREFGC
jgi:pyrroline-5-carboxylate reductase